MTRGGDAEKGGPMFPRLHVNDSEKGGPRAPPRNKMALYEQLSIPSQRYNQLMVPNSTSSNSVPHFSQQSTSANDRNIFFSPLLPGRHQYGMPHNNQSDISIPLTQVEPTEKSDEDDYRVPIFVHSHPHQERGRLADAGKFGSSDPFCFSHSLKAHEAKKTSILEGKTQQQDNLKQFVRGILMPDSGEPDSMNTQSASSTFLENSDKSHYGVNRVNPTNVIRYRLDVESRSISNRHNTTVLGDTRAAKDEINSPGIVRDISNGTELQDGGSCGSRRISNLERDDSISETSILGSISVHDMITPDDVVAIIGQKHFWKARKAISNQQRVFSVQVFELHRLIKVQRLMAASPNILYEESAFLREPTIIDLTIKKPPIAEAKVTKQKAELDKVVTQKEGSAENSVEKICLSSSLCTQHVSKPPVPSPVNLEHNYTRPLYMNNQHGNQWLIPVMSPSEGLVYKPYPVDPACGGLNPVPTGNFFPPSLLQPYYGLQYQQPFPQGYCNPYAAIMMPMMNTDTSISVSSVEQIKSAPVVSQMSGGNFAVHREDVFNLQQSSSDMDVQGSTASSPTERIKGANVLPLFPTSPLTTNYSALEASTRVIKVVPHNANTATESAARIFQSIQEERKHYDSM